MDVASFQGVVGSSESPLYPEPFFMPANSPPGEVIEDARGLLCPLPVIRLARRFEDLPIGGVVRLLADDPLAEEDVKAWCRGHRQEVVSIERSGDVLGIRVRRIL
jgi:TusA-related sulfurtransferase